MSFKQNLFQKILNKSQSFNYYKTNYQIVSNELESAQNEISDLKEEIKLKNIQINEIKDSLYSMEEGFVFSIIIAVYNTEKYLSDAIDSIINQTFNFDKVQIILVDDGSTDGSKEICLSYVETFPNNIKYIYQENQGQATARNNGLKIAEGKFINFLDSDDKLDLNTLEEVYLHFFRFGDEIDVISIPRYLFGIENGPMHFNEKYEHNRIVDIQNEFDFPQVSISAAFIRKDSLCGNFDTKLIISEDSLLLNKTILNKGKFGVVGNVKYLYRKRSELNSTIDTKKSKKEYFSLRMKIYFKELINFSIKKYGFVPKYIQSVLIYDTRWLFEQRTEINVLSDKEKIDYYNHIFDVIQYIDDDIILSQEFNKSLKTHMINFKRGIDDFNRNNLEYTEFKLSKQDILKKLNNNEYDQLTISIKSPNPVIQKNWGDYYFALSLKKYFERKGFNVLVHEREYWYIDNSEVDITLVLRGYDYEYIPNKNHINLMWNLYNPHIISKEEFEKYDFIFVASKRCAGEIKNKVTKPVQPLLQCTDSESFFPEYDPNLEEDILFVGNTRGFFREIIKDILSTDFDVSIYGAEWEDYIPNEYIKGEFISNDELHKYYSSCKILLNDHLESMKDFDYLSNRLFDALACGTLIISDKVPSINLFEGAVITYDGVEDLNKKIEFYLDNDEERRLRAAHGRKIVLENHTFEKRVEQILDCLKDIKID